MRGRRLRWIALALIIVVVAGGGLYYFRSVYRPDQTSEEPSLQTAVARRGDLTLSATAAGTVIAAAEVQLSFPTNGVLAELLVQVGDTVQAGDVLARLDDNEVRQALVNAQLQLAQAAMRTDGTATGTGMSFDDISIEQARLNLEQAQTALDDLLNWEPDEDEVALAEANLSAAEASYQAAVGQASATTYNIEVAGINLEQAQEALAAAQEAYDAAWDEARDWEQYIDEPICDPGEREPCTGQTWAQRIARDRESATSAVERAEDNLRLAQIEYDRTVSGSASSSKASAESSVLNAQLNLEKALRGPNEEEIEAAQRAVRQAELNLQQALLNGESNALSLAQAELNVASAEAALEETELVAPVAGTVMVINGSVGESVGAGFIVLADLERPLLEVYLDESDLNMVGVGYEVEVVFDALPEETYRGEVVQIDPQLVNEAGVTAVRALVELGAESFAKPQRLPVGLNATVEVIGGQVENGVLVPVEALRELAAGQYAVFVMEDGEPRLRQVEVGLMDFTFAEIVSGLEAGEVVTTGIVQTE